MPEWSTACVDWERRILASESLIAQAPLFPDQADQALRIYGALRMVDATGSPLMSECMLGWANDFVRAIFGAYDHDTGRRYINEFLLLISKKNGKSSIAAGVMLTALIMNWRPSGEFIILAPTKEIADNSYKPIRDMVKADDELQELLHVQDHLRTITHLGTRATLKVVAADSDTVSGKKAIGVFVDELHEFGLQAKAANMLLEATGGLTSRPEGFVIYATTQSAAPPAGVFKQKLDYARRVRDGEIEDKSFLPVLYEFPPAMLKSGACREFENAYVTNPNWGVSVDAAYIEKRYRQAQEEGEESFRLFLSKHLNVEIGLNLRADRWAGAEFWEAQARSGLTLERIIERSEVLEVGIDGGGLDDLLGLSVIGRDAETGEWLVWCRAWANRIVLERRKSEAARLNDLAAEGTLILCEEFGEDVVQLAQVVQQCEESELLDKIGVDQLGLGGIVDAITGLGIEIERMVGISQGYKLTTAIKTAERKLSERRLFHEGSALMAWCVGNAKTVPVGNAIAITKQASGSGKIDPLMAMFNAIELMSRNPQGQRSFWDKEEE